MTDQEIEQELEKRLARVVQENAELGRGKD